MTTLLHLDASARGAESVSRTLTAEFARDWAAANPGGHVVYRDLAHEPLPHLTSGWVQAAFSPPDSHDSALRFALSRSDALVDELLAADVVLLGAPVYNFSVPASLKAWIDQVARAGRTFVYSESGPRGLLQGKRVVVVQTSGSGREALASMGMDHHTPYLRGFFGFLGITDVEVVSQWGAVPDVAERTLEQARQALRALVTADADADADADAA
jgi:FMN-dependent NADH-azoreductase